jgi:peptidoglycan/LPS O-acetylase OafA/YrhL
MWVMFALAGCLTASSLERRGPLPTVRSRVRRLLPPLWALAAVAVPLMLVHGWLTDAQNPLRWRDLLWWVLPLANPPASGWGGPFVLALWYIRAYLWFVLLSPILWWAFRRWPIATLLAPLSAAVLLDSPLVNLPSDRVTDVVWATALYGTGWILGFARYTGLLQRIPLWACALAAVALCAAGIAWGTARLGPAVAWPLDNPAADALWGTGYALILMRWRPTMAWIDRIPPLARLISGLNARAVTIYIWHLPAIFAAGGILLLLGVDLATPGGTGATLAAGGLLTIAAVLVVGWIEDLAARRRPKLVPSA